jgi:anaerobic selenocysteine-containing dehydrogenase
MMTVRTHDQYNTTIYGLNDRYRGVYNERRVIFMNEEDMRDYGLENLNVVDIKSHFNGEERIAEKFKVVKYAIPRKCCATYFPETNVLVPIGSVAEKSNTPTSKFVKVTLTKHPVK